MLLTLYVVTSMNVKIKCDFYDKPIEINVIHVFLYLGMLLCANRPLEIALSVHLANSLQAESLWLLGARWIRLSNLFLQKITKNEKK